MLAEQELTMLLRTRQEVCSTLGIEAESLDSETQRLMEKTDVGAIVQ